MDSVFSSGSSFFTDVSSSIYKTIQLKCYCHFLTLMHFYFHSKDNRVFTLNRQNDRYLFKRDRSLIWSLKDNLNRTKCRQEIWPHLKLNMVISLKQNTHSNAACINAENSKMIFYSKLIWFKLKPQLTSILGSVLPHPASNSCWSWFASVLTSWVGRSAPTCWVCKSALDAEAGVGTRLSRLAPGWDN